ncbi:hypothetical protein ACTA71_005464 [Dictyostelium dimigraforme]
MTITKPTSTAYNIKKQQQQHNDDNDDNSSNNNSSNNNSNNNNNNSTNIHCKKMNLKTSLKSLRSTIAIMIHTVRIHIPLNTTSQVQYDSRYRVCSQQQTALKVLEKRKTMGGVQGATGVHGKSDIERELAALEARSSSSSEDHGKPREFATIVWY